MPASKSAPANSSGGRPASHFGLEPGRAAPSIAHGSRIPNKFFEKDGRVVDDQSARTGTRAWAHFITRREINPPPPRRTVHPRARMTRP